MKIISSLEKNLFDVVDIEVKVGDKVIGKVIEYDPETGRAVVEIEGELKFKESWEKQVKGSMIIVGAECVLTKAFEEATKVFGLLPGILSSAVITDVQIIEEHVKRINAEFANNPFNLELKALDHKYYDLPAKQNFPQPKWFQGSDSAPFKNKGTRYNCRKKARRNKHK